MIYTSEEKQRMELLLSAFAPYWEDHPYYDIVYSQKAGYLCVITEEDADNTYFRIKSFEDMLRMFVDDYLSDAQAQVRDPLYMDYSMVREALYPILSNLGPESDFCLDFMEERFIQWQWQLQRHHELYQKDTEELKKLLEKHPDLFEKFFSKLS